MNHNLKEIIIACILIFLILVQLQISFAFPKVYNIEEFFLKNQERFFEDSINILNVQSYPVVGGNWKIEFETIGVSDLEISGINGTVFGIDLEFLELRCGDELVNYELRERVIFVPDYECDKISLEVSRVLTSGAHHLEFRFGGAVDYAHNFASEPYMPVGEWGAVANLQEVSWIPVNFNHTFSDVPVVVHSLDADYNYDDNPCQTRIRNVSETGFEIRAESWSDDYSCPLTGVNAYWLAMEKGIHYLASEGAVQRVVEVQNFTLPYTACGSGANPSDWTYSANWRNFNYPWTYQPLVLGGVQSANDEDVITHYIRGCTTTNADTWDTSCVEIGLNGMENDGATQPCTLHTSNEEGGFIAWEMDSDYSNSEVMDNSGNIGNGINYYSWEAFWEADTVAGSQTDAYPMDSDYITLSQTYSEGAAFASGIRIDGGNGLFPLLDFDAETNAVYELADEDRYGDDEQSHTNEPFEVLFFNASSGFLYSNESLLFDLTINSPINITYNNSLIVFNLSLSKEVSGCNYTTNDWATNYTMSTIDGINFNASEVFSDDSYVARFVCGDSYGNTNETEYVGFSIDTTTPILTIVAPQNISYGTTDLSINFFVSDLTLDSCWYTNDSGITNYSLLNCENVSYIAGEDSTTIDIFANDTLGRETLDSVTFFVDSLFPLIDYSGDSFANNSIITGDSVYINTSVIENNLENITFYLYDSLGISKRENTFYDSTRSINWSLLADDVYTYNVTIYDVMNRMNSTITRTITLDNVKPLIDFSSETKGNASFVSGDFIFVNTTVVENNFANITFYLFNETDLVNETIFYDSTRSINWTNLGDGIYFYSSTVFDLANHNSSTLTRTIKLDTIKPIVNFVFPTEDNFANISASSIFANASVTEDNFANITFRLYNSVGSLINQTTFTDSTRSINWTNLGDGIYFYNASVFDLANNFNSSETRQIGLDTTGPIINIISPEAKAYGYNESLPLNYSVYDELVLVDSCWWNLDNSTNQSIVCGENTTFGTSEGSHVLYFYSNDSFGNSGNSEVSFAVSTTGPAIVLINPEANYFFNSSTEVFFNYSAEDPDKVDMCSLFGDWNGWHENQTFDLIDNETVVGNFSLNFSEEGNYKWNIMCNDTLGWNSFAATNFTFAIDKTYPLIDFSEGTEVDGANVSQNFIFVNVSVNETNFANLTFDLYNEGMTRIKNDVFSDNTRSVNWVGLGNGVYFYNASVYDLANHKNSTNLRKITLDVDSPSGDLISPDDEIYTKDSSQNLTASFSDNIGLKNATLYIFNETGNLIYESTVLLAGASFATVGIVYNFITDGIYKWFFRARDLAGNFYDTENRTITIDTILPLINFSFGTEKNNSYFARDWLYININLNETNFANITFALYDDEGIERESTFTDSTRSINWTLLNDDIYFYNVSVRDLAGNFGFTETRTITLDNTNPLVDFVFPTKDDSDYASQDFIFANVSITEDNFANITFRLYDSAFGLINQTIFIDSTREINWSGVSDGVYYYNFTVYDKASNFEDSETRKITLDTTLPSVSFIFPTENDNSEFEREWIFANASITEDNFENISFSLFNETSLINETNFFSLTKEINWTNLLSSNVTYYYNITVFDLAGNFNSSETRQIKLIDTTKPEFILYSPQNTTYNYNESISLNYFASDVNLDSCWYNIDGGSDVLVSDCTNSSIDVSDEASYNLNFYVNDSLNQINSTSVSFFVNSSLILTFDYRIQRGSIFVDGTSEASVDSFDQSKTFILHTARSLDSGPDSLFVKSGFTNPQTINFENYATGGGANVLWEVVTGPEITVVRKSASYSAGESEINLTINSVNLSNSFLIVSANANDGTTQYNQEARWRAFFYNDSLVTLRRGIGVNVAGEISLQVVSWTGAKVQRGSFLASELSGTDLITESVSLENSFLIFSSTSDSGTALDYNNVGGFIADSNTVSFYRQDDDTGYMYADWFVIEAPFLDVRRGSFDIDGTTSPVETSFNSLVNLTRAFHTSSWDSTGSGNTHANAIVTTDLTDVDNLETITGTTASNIKNVSWEVIEIKELDAPIVSLINPKNNSNFSTSAISAFGFSVTDNSSILNCSLFADFNSSWSRNQTISSPTKETAINFSGVNVTIDNFYIWNVECEDVYGNIGRGENNFTFSSFYFPESPLISSIIQSSNDGTGDVTIFWNSSNHTVSYKIYSGNNLSNLSFLNETSELNYTDNSFAGNRRKFYSVRAVNPVGENVSEEYFGFHVYSLKHNGLTKNWIGFPTNFSYLTDANETLQEITNATSVTMYNSTKQRKVTCNDFSCPDWLSCTETNCNFEINSVYSYEIGINSTAPPEINWSGVGIVNVPQDIYLIKNLTSYGKNWISMTSFTNLTDAQSLFESISNADAVSRWNSETQESEGLIFIWGMYVGENFDINIEEGYEISVTANETWEQS